MSTQIQYRRGTSTEHQSFTGAVGEITIDTTLNSIRVHDGSTLGGILISRSLDTVAAFTHANSAYGHANSAYDKANSAYNHANTKFASAGGTISGDVEISGNLTVTGYQVYSNTTVTLIRDNIITLNASIGQSEAPTSNAGIEIDRGSSTNTQILWNEVTDKWTFTNDGTIYNDIAAAGRLDSAYGHANSAYDQANTALAEANAGYEHANSAYNKANSAYDHANTKFASAGGKISGDVVVTGNITPDVTLTSNIGNSTNRFHTIFVGPGSVDVDGIKIQNTAGVLTISGATDINFGTGTPSVSGISTHANSAYDKANSGYNQANTALAEANAGYEHANSAYDKANSAYDHANTKFASAGGTIDGNVNITGNLNVTGNVVTYSSQEVVINDPIVLYANNNTGNILDIGFVAHYVESSNTKHTGLVKHVASNKWYLFENYGPHIQENNILNISDASLAKSNLVANLTDGTVSNLSAAIAVVDGGTGAKTFTAGSILIGNGTGALQSLANTGTAGTYGNASHVPVVTTDGYGRVSGVSNVAIAIAAGAVSGLAASATTDTTNATNISSGTLNAARLPTSGVVAATYANVSHVPVISVDATGRVTAVTNTAISISAAQISSDTLPIDRGGTNQTTFSNGQRVFFNGTALASLANTTTTVTGGLSAANTITSFTVNSYGDVTAYTGAAIAIAAEQVTSGTLNAARLPTSGVTATTYSSPTISVDQYGRITAAANGSGGGLSTSKAYFFSSF